MALFLLLPHRRAAGPSALQVQVVINEIGWSGSAYSYSDEWIELHNPTAEAIDLAGWTLSAADGTPTIGLVGSVPSGGYFLLERSDDCTIDDIPADLIYTGALEDSGEILWLRNAQGVLLDSANADGGPWPAGGKDPDISMERIDPIAPDADANWLTNDGVTRQGHDCGGAPIAGTPRAWNSATPRAANLRVRKTGPQAITSGAEITYTLALSNLGALPAENTQLSDLLPPAVMYVRDNAPVPPVQPLPGLLVWNLGAVPTGGLAITVTLVGLADGEPGSLLTNTVSAASPVTDAIPGDNVATWHTVIVSPPVWLPDLVVAKTGPISVATGTELTYTVALANVGTLPAPGCLVTDTLPAGLTYVRDTAPYPLEQPTPDVLVWQIGEVATSSAPITFTLTGEVVAPAGACLTNSLEARSTLTDAHPADNAASWKSLVMPPAAESMVLIDALLYDGYVSGDLDEAVRLWNLGTASAELSQWRVTDGYAQAIVPAGTELPAGSEMWLARNAVAFAQSFGFQPDLVLDPWPGFANEGDECTLQNAQGEVVDALVYEGGDPNSDGWDGPAVQPYAPSGAFAQEGQILYRKRDQSTGLPFPDTDSAGDWAQDANDGINGRRVQYPGWDMDAHLFTTRVTETATISVAVGPDHLYETLAGTLGAAQESIQLELYSFESVSLTQLLVDRLDAGVSVTLLLEGGPVGGMSDQGRWVASTLDQAGAEVYFLTGDGDEIHTRYAFQHAKMGIVDGQWLAVGTQNWNDFGMPNDPKHNGTSGQRGVYLITDAPGIVSAAQEVLAADMDPAHHADVVDCEDLPPDRPYCTPPLGFSPLLAPDWISYPVQFASPMAVSGTFTFEWLRAPENALRTTDGLLGLLARAGPGDVLRVEQNYEHPAWGGPPDPIPNPRLEAYLDAARRGATVRLLLDGFDSHDGRNAQAVFYVNATARAEGLPIQARLGNPTGGGIHNKMVLAKIDGLGHAHLGSLNGGEVSHKLNRELALQVQSDDIHAFLAAVFDCDWGAATPPVYLPLVLRNTSPTPPPDRPVITEVYYAAPKLLEWVEIHNPTPGSVSLSGWRLGDAASPGEHEGMYTFPAGTTLTAGGTLVVAVSAAAYGWGTPDLELLDTSPQVPSMIRDPSWGLGEWELAIAGDEVALLLADGTPVDVVTYGSGRYPGVIPHPGVGQATHSLARWRAWPDTDDCSLDFYGEPSPAPGLPPS